MLCLHIHPLISQTKNQDKLGNIPNFESLAKLIVKQTSDSSKIQIAASHLIKAKNLSDTLGMADGYYFLLHLKETNRVQYADSLIEITKDKNYEKYPASAYMAKGNSEFEQGNYFKGLELYIKASHSAKKNGNEYLYRTIKFNIGLLKNTAGEREEAQEIFVDHVNFLENNPHYRTPVSYNKAVYALADSYIHTKKIDLAEEYINKGIHETLKTKDSATYSYLVVTSGIHQYLKHNFNTAIDSLKKGKALIRIIDKIPTRIATCDYYIAQSHKSMGNEEISIQFFKKVDTTLRKTNDVIPEILDTYDYLFDYYKSKQDYKQQLVYINTRLKLDSIIDNNRILLARNINEKYDTVELISEKEKLITQLKRDQFLKENTITILILSLAILSIIIVLIYRRSYLNKKRFLKLLEELKNKDTNLVTPINQKTVKKEEIDIPKDVINIVLQKLENFEGANKFTEKNHTLNSLAKDLNTNSAYLSKIINVYKNVNFANYLNNLRIDFAIDQLSKNSSLRSYTIQAIAEEVGFKNAQSFSSAFNKKTGIYPSYFIKHLQAKK